MTDAVAIALITGITTTVTSVVTAIVTLLTRRQVKRLREESKQEAEHTRAYIEMAACHPDDLPVSAPYRYEQAQQPRA